MLAICVSQIAGSAHHLGIANSLDSGSRNRFGRWVCVLFFIFCNLGEKLSPRGYLNLTKPAFRDVQRHLQLRKNIYIQINVVYACDGNFRCITFFSLYQICDLFILFNFYSIDKSTKKRFPMFSLTNVNVFCKCEKMLTAATHSIKVGTEACLTLVLLITMFNCLGIEDTDC